MLDDAELAYRWRAFIQPEVFRHAVPADEERAALVLLGGQPGAGKTRAVDLVRRELYPDTSLTPIIGDDYRRFHPDYRRTLRADPLRMPAVTGPASGRWIQMCVDHAVANRYSFLLEGTWRDPNVPLRGVQLGAQADYRVHAVALAVPPHISRLATLERFYRDVDQGHEARWTPPVAHNQASAQLPKTVQSIASDARVGRVTVVDRTAAILYDAEGAAADRGVAARDALITAMNRPQSDAAARAWVDLAHELHQLHQRHTAHNPEARAVWEAIMSHDVPRISRDTGVSSRASHDPHNRLTNVLQRLEDIASRPRRRVESDRENDVDRSSPDRDDFGREL